MRPVPPPPDEPAIAIENVHKVYGRIEALRGVSLVVGHGEIFGLLGANGAGKSTLMNVLVGSTRPTAGTARVLGLDPVTQAPALRARIGSMPQAPALYDDLPARDNIRFFARAHRLDRLDQRVDEVLEFTGLRDRARDPVYGFSGGMKQRISLACALVHQPQALFLDEPTAGVDPKLREAFWQHFRDLAARGVTIFVSTHLMDEALYCDRLAIMRDGALLARDTPANILRRGHAVVSVWRGGEVSRETVTDYPDRLPALLRPYGLDPAITRIEIAEETLDAIILALIDRQAGARADAAELAASRHAGPAD